VCLFLISVCVSFRAHIYGITRPIFTKLFARDTFDRGSVVLFWLRCDTSFTSGFMDVVKFARNGPYADMSIPLQRLASLRRCVVVRRLTPLLRRIGCVVLDDGWRRNYRRVRRARGDGGGACNAPLASWTHDENVSK